MKQLTQTYITTLIITFQDTFLTIHLLVIYIVTLATLSKSY